ncbi:hypothetical protein MNBD_DELTA01-441 [hydrothermal vent metagenome]|uniref:HNH nuclease domain-containing protein n=1 Tax=hydrothermal vent metagenome TaxID=652676 RepID=A0A3B0RNJ9_9ZZZZ
MKFELERDNLGISDEDLLEDLRVCAKALGKKSITTSEYDTLGKVRHATIRRRFGYWYVALQKAGLETGTSQRVITEEELFQNIKEVWTSLRRQPRRREIDTDLSKFSASTYSNRFGTWRKALDTFVIWVNSDETDNSSTSEPVFQESYIEEPERKRTPRHVTERQRFRIFVRDGFRCLSCGASPITTPGVELEVDHVVPWSKGGETVDSNLKTKCKRCNRGKGNGFCV